MQKFQELPITKVKSRLKHGKKEIKYKVQNVLVTNFIELFEVYFDDWFVVQTTTCGFK